MTLNLELPPELEQWLEQEAARNGQPVQGYALALLTKQLGARSQVGGSPSGKARAPHLWEVAADILQGVPDNELERLPVDLSENLDLYLYGAPRP